MHGFLSLKVCTVSDILKRNLVECILPRVGVFGADGDGKVEQRENDTHHSCDLRVLPSGRSWWAERAGLGQGLDDQLWNFPTTDNLQTH